MSETAQQTVEGNAPESDGISPPTAPPSGANPEGTDFKWGENAPPEWRGRDAGYATQAYDQLKREHELLATQVAEYLRQQQAVQQTPPAAPRQDNPDLWITDPAAAEAHLSNRIMQNVQQTIQQSALPILQSNAALAKSASQNDAKYKDAWTKWGREIEDIMNSSQIHPVYRSNKEMWDNAAQVVKGRHAEEIAQERAQDLVRTMQGAPERGGTRSAAGTSGGQSTAWDKIEASAYGKDLLGKYSKSAIMAAADKMGYSLDEYADVCSKSTSFRAPNKPDELINRKLYKGPKKGDKK